MYITTRHALFDPGESCWGNTELDVPWKRLLWVPAIHPARAGKNQPEDHPKYSTTRVRAAHSNQQHTKYYKMDWVWDGMDRSGGVRYRANVPGQVRKALV